MMSRAVRLAANGIAIGVLMGLAAPAVAQKERPRGILRNLIQTIAPGSPEDLERRAIRTQDPVAAFDLYETLESRFGSRPEGVRAAIWLGLYEYGRNNPEGALVHFEEARRSARDPHLMARATFWCEEARLITGREPIAGEEGEARGGEWETLRGLTRVDRAIQAGRRVEAEQRLLLLESEARRAGFLGLHIARWGEIFRLMGPGGRIDPEVLRPILRATAELPERLRAARPNPAPVDSAPPVDEKWTVQFGAFLDRDNAAALVGALDSRGVKAHVEEGEEGGRLWFRVRLDESLDRAEADTLSQVLQAKAGVPCQVVPIP